jgi:hypothetical protein
MAIDYLQNLNNKWNYYYCRKPDPAMHDTGLRNDARYMVKSPIRLGQVKQATQIALRALQSCSGNAHIESAYVIASYYAMIGEKKAIRSLEKTFE